MSNALIADRWSVTLTEATVATIIPDGCQDFILRHQPGLRPQILWFPLANETQSFSLERGLTLTGVRLLPGVRLPRHVSTLLAVAGDRDMDWLLPRILEGARRSAAAAEALACLAEEDKPLPLQARQLGLSPRSFRRLMVTETGRPPRFWQALARARRTARLILQAQLPLAECAVAAGFADQAHMNRSMQRWFGSTPGQLGRIPDLAQQLSAPAFA